MVVRAAPGRPVPDRARPVLVAVDGRPGSAALVRRAAELAAGRDAALHVAHVWGESTGDVLRRLGRRQRVPHREEAEQALQDIAAAVTADHPGLRVRWTVERGGPAWSVLELSDLAQLVVVGRHRGRGVGTLARMLLLASSCPVLLARTRSPRTLPTHAGAGVITEATTASASGPRPGGDRRAAAGADHEPAAQACAAWRSAYPNARICGCRT